MYFILVPVFFPSFPSSKFSISHVLYLTEKILSTAGMYMFTPVIAMQVRITIVYAVVIQSKTAHSLKAK